MNTLSLISDAKYFDINNTKFAEIRKFLDSSDVSEKLEAMKRLMAMITLGRDVSMFMPDVVKNVIVKNTEVKKLVYMFLVEHAESQPELALLSINTFQKDLQSPSQRTRGNAMKAMSSIRVPVVVPLVILALKAAVKDTSPYVRRAAATAIPKLFDLDPEEKPVLVECIEELLTNSDPTVLGPTLFAFQEICPDNFEILHRHFRKVVHLLADIDEWGQIVTVNVLMKYARNQFLCPFPEENASEAKEENHLEERTMNLLTGVSPAKVGDIVKPDAAEKSGGNGKEKKVKGFYSDDDEANDSDKLDYTEKADKGFNDDDSWGSDDDDAKTTAKKTRVDDRSSASSKTTAAKYGLKKKAKAGAAGDLDEDHATLLKGVALLFHSMNAGVIVGAASLFYHCAPREMIGQVAAPLMRAARSSRSHQFGVFAVIASIAQRFPAVFRAHYKELFIQPIDPRYLRELKLEVLANVTTSLNAGPIIDELVTYVNDPDKAFVCRSIQVMGRVALASPSVVSRCMRYLLSVVKRPSPAVSAEAVVVLRLLLQKHTSIVDSSSIKRMVRLLEETKVPAARQSIIWIIGEYRDKIPLLAPDSLRTLVKGFHSEDVTVKVQILNLAVKLCMSNPAQTSALFKYTMDLCKYDQSYDLRDKARLLRTMFFQKKGADGADPDASNVLAAKVKGAFKQGLLIMKPPASDKSSRLKQSDLFTLSTLSHLLGSSAIGYSGLEPFPAVQPDKAVRNPPEEKEVVKARYDAGKGKKGKQSGKASKKKAGKKVKDKKLKKEKGFYSDSEDDTGDESPSEGESELSSDASRSASDSDSLSSSSFDSNASTADDSEDENARKTKKKTRKAAAKKEVEDTFDSFDSDASTPDDSDADVDTRASAAFSKAEAAAAADSASEAESDDGGGIYGRKKKTKQPQRASSSKGRESSTSSFAAKSTNAGIDFLGSLENLNIDFSSSPASSSSSLSSMSLSSSPSSRGSLVASASSVQASISKGASGQLLNPIAGGGLSILYKFNRKPSAYNEKYNSVQLTLMNQSTSLQDFESIRFSQISVDHHPFEEIPELKYKAEAGASLHIDFGGKTSELRFYVHFTVVDKSAGIAEKLEKKFAIKFGPPVGELLTPMSVSSADAAKIKKQHGGMNETVLQVPYKHSFSELASHFLTDLNMHLLPQEYNNSLCQFTGSLKSDGSLLLIECEETSEGSICVRVYCGNFLFSGRLINAVAAALGRS